MTLNSKAIQLLTAPYVFTINPENLCWPALFSSWLCEEWRPRCPLWHPDSEFNPSRSKPNHIKTQLTKWYQS